MNLKKIGAYLIEHNTVIIFIVLVTASALVSDVFFTQVNLSNLLRQVSGIGIISLGMLLVILTGGIDLSVGAVMALTAVLCALFTGYMPVPAAILAALVCGLTVGMLNGYLVAAHRIAPFIATLALMTVARGLAFIFSKGAPVPLDEGTALSTFGNGTLLGIPYPVWVFVLLTALVYILNKHHVGGRLIIAVGSNEEATRLSGIRVNLYKYIVYAASGLFAAIAGVISVSRTNLGSPNVGVALELDAIAAVVIGGASLKGGKGSVINTFLGVLILGLIGNILNLKNVPAYPQQVIKGVIIIAAVLLQRFQASERR